MLTNDIFRSCPREWKFVKIDEVVSVRDERTVNDGQFPLCSLTIEEGVIEKPERYVREFLVKSKDKTYKKVYPKDIVFNPMNLRWGAIAISRLDKVGILSPVYNVLFANESLDCNYLAYLLKSNMMIRVYNKYAQGTLVERTGVNLKAFLDFSIPYPPLAEQRKIAAILTSVDEAIAATQRIIDQTERVKRGLMLQLLTRGIGHTKFKQTEIGEIPAEWEVAYFSKYCRVNPTYTVNNGTKCAYVEMAAVDETSPDIKYYGERAVGQTSGSRFKEGDVLFARITPCTENGKTALVRNLPTEVGIGSTEFIVLSPDKKKLVPMYLYYLAKSDSVRNYAIGRMTGTTGRQRVPKEVFTEELIIPIPPLSEQIIICKMLEAHDSRLTIEKAYREKLKTLRTALMQILLTGKVRVKVDEEAGAVV